MDITIIGTGNMARGIATRALDGGHAVTLKRAHELEALGYLHMTLQGPLGSNYGSAVKLLA